MRKIHHSEMKEINYELILRALLHGNCMGRVDLVKETGLSASTISRCVAKLMENGIIVETGPSKNGKIGRRAMNLEINADALTVLLVDIGAERVNYAVGKANGSIIKLQSSKTPLDFSELLEDVKELAGSVRNANVIAFSVPGMVNVETNTIMFVPSTGWRDITVQLENKVVFLDNEANLGIVAEAFQQREIRNSKCSVFVTVREGFGTGLWINGKIYRGPSYTAGEFGHTTLDLNSDVVCRCGKKGCLENFTSVLNLLPDTNGGYSNYSKRINELLSAGGRRLDDYLDVLSTALANIVNALNPEYLIIGGELAGLDPSFYATLERLVKSKSLYHAAQILKVIPSTFTMDTYLYGALYAVFEEYFIPNVVQLIS